MPYSRAHGEYVIRYLDLPRQGPQPDGDTISFRPQTISALIGPASKRGNLDINKRGVAKIRYEAIDTLETHFKQVHQQLELANAARDRALAELGFRNIEFFPDMENVVKDSDVPSLPGHLLVHSLDPHGRVIAFVFAGQPVGTDAENVFLTSDVVNLSVNTLLLREGLAYPAFYTTLPSDLRQNLSEIAQRARQKRLGVWAVDVANPDTPAKVTDMASLSKLSMWPKLFRRLADYFMRGNRGLGDFDQWLRADPRHRDDEVLILPKGEFGNMHDVIAIDGDEVRMRFWPEQLVIRPDP